MTGADEIRLNYLAKACAAYGLTIRWGAWGLGLGEAATRWHAWNGKDGAEYVLFIPVFHDGRLWLVHEDAPGFRVRVPAHTRKEVKASLQFWTRGAQ